MIRVIGSQGMHAASVRAIAREAECNEAVLYQHFPGKAAMQETIFEDIVSGMSEQKKALLDSPGKVEDLISAWIRLTYQYYDETPNAFAYALLSFPSVVPQDHPMQQLQSTLFRSALKQSSCDKGFRIRTDEVALTQFRAALLGIPRSLHIGRMEGIAEDHVEDVARICEAILIEAIPEQSELNGSSGIAE
jgi:AcrR family transcriptional regulator